jgi:hypothetical protein
MIAILIELNGPGGMFAELGRSTAIGPAPTEAIEEVALILEAQEFTIKRLAPGRAYAEVWDEYNAFLTPGSSKRTSGRSSCDRTAGVADPPYRGGKTVNDTPTRVGIGGLQVDPGLYGFVNQEVLPGLELEPAQLWDGLGRLVRECGPRIRRALDEREPGPAVRIGQVRALGSST